MADFAFAEAEGVEWGCFPAWEKWGVVHGFLCRNGGCSPQFPGGLNLSYNVGDDRTNVLANRQKMAAALGFPLERAVACQQVHSTHVAVVTEKLGGSIGSLTTYTVIANVFTMVIIPSLFPMVEKGADVSFLYMSAMVFRNVTTVLVVPLLLALLSRKFLPKWVDKVKSVKDLGFYMWCFNLTILMGETIRNILHAEVSGWILALLLIVPLFVCLIQFAIGKAVGRHYDASISAGQALGQKNTIVGIWLTLTFLNPLAAVAPGAYVVWQNLVNGWQLWYKEKYGKLKW